MSESFEIEKYYQDRNFISATLIQLEKDFSESGIELQLNHRIFQGIEDLIAELEEPLENLMKNNYSAYLNLLYRIDLNESRIRKEINLQPDLSINKIIAGLIIKRELQKVVIREFYKKQGS